jgi:hypothetical protein
MKEHQKSEGYRVENPKKQADGLHTGPLLYGVLLLI